MNCNKFYISREVVEKLGLPVGEALMLLSLYFNDPIGQSTIRSLRNKGLLEFKRLDYNSDPEGIEITKSGAELIESLFLNSELGEKEVDRVEILAKKLQEIFPQGKKTGTNYYFRGNHKDITLKLKKFFKIYGNKYSDEQILNAAREYVKSFNGDYSYMRLLGYFIWKCQIKTDADGNNFREEVSDLATYIENAGQEETLGNDWTSTLM